MKVNEIIELYKIVTGYLPKMKRLALGGYPSLVLQGILKETRETGDLDIAEFPDNSAFPVDTLDVLMSEINQQDMTIRDNFPALESQAVSVRFKTLESAYSERFRKKMDQTWGKLELGAENQTQELIKMGVNKSSSLTLIDMFYGRDRPNGIKKQEDKLGYSPGAYYDAARLDSLSGLNSNFFDAFYRTNPLATGTTYAVTNSYDQTNPWFEKRQRVEIDLHGLEKWLKFTEASISRLSTPDGTPLGNLNRDKENMVSMKNIISHTYSNALLSPEAEKLLGEYQEKLCIEMKVVDDTILSIKNRNKDIILKFFYDNRPREIFRLADFFKRNDLPQVKIDLFTVSESKMNKFSVVVGEIKCVHYYLILKAKYEYCKNLLTDEESFQKHIKDLTDSYAAKRILGINSPEDIERLIRNRRNEATE